MTQTHTSTPAASGHPGGPTVPAVHLSGVTKDFGPVHAVRGIDLALEPGEIVAFLGPNGAGKTTTIDMVLGLSQPTSGSVEVLGLDPRQAIARGLVSAVMQTGGLLKDLSVRETVAYTASLFADTAPVDEVLRTAGIESIADRRVGKCSGGEQQRLRFAMALLSDPALLLLDEPTTGMDVEGRRAFWSAIREDAGEGSHRALRDPLPRGGRPVRRPDHPDQPRPDRRRRHRQPDQGPGRRPHRPGHPARRRRRRARRGWPASRPSRSAATPSTCTPRTPTPSPGTCSPRPRPTTWRSPPAVSRTRSSA